MDAQVLGNKSISEKQLVIFKLADEEFGVDINDVKEIIKPMDITRVPNGDAFITGIINLRGKIIVIVDLAKKIGLKTKNFDNDTRIIVVETKESTIGMLVDKAQEVLRVTDNKIEAAPGVIAHKINQDYISGVCMLKERLIIMLDLSKVLETK